jgi:hypothetical protein
MSGRWQGQVGVVTCWPGTLRRPPHGPAGEAWSHLDREFGRDRDTAENRLSASIDHTRSLPTSSEIYRKRASLWIILGSGRRAEENMNWLIARMIDVESFRFLLDQGEPVERGPLRRVAFKYVRDWLPSDDVDPPSGLATLDALNSAYVFIEPPEDASARLARALEYSGDAPQGGWYTTAIQDHESIVLYVPDDDSDEHTLQLFSGHAEQPLERLLIHTGLGSKAPIAPNQVERGRIEACEDGPCVDWKAECGGRGCRCRKFPSVERRVRARVMAIGGQGTVPRLSVLRCNPL